jgi:Flp pilus assembly pilin Flp
MNLLRSQISRLITDERGSEAVECVLVVGLIVLASITPITYFTHKVVIVWTKLSRSL